jgi:NAD(P)-dependent dehydrogenase (short-subunit alcohol dehydrogenase family)
MDGRVLITGATGALGGSVVRRFLAAGERVLAVGTREAELAELARLAPAPAVVVRRVDLSSTAAGGDLFAAWRGEAGPAPIVVHLVGGFRYARLAETSDEDWSALVGLNLETTFRVLRESARAFGVAGGGALVAVSSPAGLVGEAGVGGYAATKAAVLRLVEWLAREVGPLGARANAVLPGTMDTPANRAAMPRADPARWVSPAAVAEVIHFLTTPAAAGVNGAAVRVPGRDL